MNQNNIILILILISILVAFYAIYLAMENSKKIKKINIEMKDLLKIVSESSNIRTINHPISETNTEPNNKYEEFPTLDEINQFNNSDMPMQNNNENMEPLSNELKSEMENFLLITKNSVNESNDILDTSNIETALEEYKANEEENEGDSEEGDIKEDIKDNQNNNLVGEEESGGEESGGEESGGEESGGEESGGEESGGEESGGEESGGEESGGEESGGEESGGENSKNLENNNEKVSIENTLTLLDYNYEYLNNLNVENLKNICKSESLSGRGRKMEIIERILKKKDAQI